MTSQILFLSDIEEELIAAISAGMRVAQLVRDEKTKSTEKFKVLDSFAGFDVDKFD